MKTWFVTGANRGLGLSITRAALEAGDRVVAAARNPQSVETSLAAFGDRVLAVRLDVTDDAAIEAAVKQAVERFGRIDILVNNAGYGLLAAFEEISAASVARQFATNVFGTMAVTRAILPVMRAQRSGHVVTVSSTAGLRGFDGASIYVASKFALEGWSESVGLEVARFGIHFTLIEPGEFRTDFLDASSASHADLSIPDYAETSRQQKEAFEAGNHAQAGDPEKLGKAVVTLANAKEPPVRFAAGVDAYRVVSDRAETLRSSAEAWKELSLSLNLDN